MKKNTKIYTVVMILIFIFAMTTVAYGYNLYENPFFYQSHFASEVFYTDIVAKSDDSSAIVAYDDGPAAGNIMYVEMWGSKTYGGTYVNNTLRHAYNGKYVTYYIVERGQQEYIKNLVYETYGEAFAKLRVYITTSGNVYGRWSPTTR